ncbi:uncharacterized protein LOC100378156 [Saccoglossus kowalevskii]|uniref:Uncharacterized protein LOC100378156 n=1 Tax=Saccoglossus kowalevskii TaxID=10224 RepID=A0ABM0M1T1_SACKO|nr:PREDICTED: uncharacterized protein LOC100378156 [Saccoglossus kowalevskii]
MQVPRQSCIALFFCFIVCVCCQSQYKSEAQKKRDYLAQQQQEWRDKTDRVPGGEVNNPYVAYQRYQNVYNQLRSGSEFAEPNRDGMGRTANSKAYGTHAIANQGYPNSDPYYNANANRRWYKETYRDKNNDDSDGYYKHDDHWHAENIDPRYGSPLGRDGRYDTNYRTNSKYYRDQDYINRQNALNAGTAGSKTGYAKPGYCPIISEKLAGNCRKICNSDKECPGYKICCQNSCGGTACLDPLDEDPCKDYQCPLPGQVCINEGSHAWCACEAICPDTYEPVCGDNKQMYNNKCYMNMYACEFKTNINEIACDVLGIKVDARQSRYGYNSATHTEGAAMITIALALIACILQMVQLVW